MDKDEILKNVYKYQSKAELTQEDIDTVVEMFDKPEKFVLLRKMLQVLTQEERELQVPSEEAIIGTSPEDLAAYGLQVAINARADEKIRQSLLSFYHKVKAHHVKIKETEIDLDEKSKKVEKEQIKKLEEEKEAEKQRVGDNV